MPALEPADMALRVELDPDAPDQIKLGFECKFAGNSDPLRGIIASNSDPF